jgi:hypothetical protein
VGGHGIRNAFSGRIASERRLFRLCEYRERERSLASFLTGGLLFDTDDRNYIEDVVAIIFAEAGSLGEGWGTYESVDASFLKPIRLESGAVLPKSSVRIRVEAPEQGPVRLKRADKAKRFGIYRKADLSVVLPDSLFLANPRLAYEKI